MKPEVTELALAQCSPAGAVLARAFLEEPWWSAVIPDRDRRRRALPSIMTADLRHGLLSGQLAEATPSLRAVSWWEPPGYQDTFLPWLRCLPSLGATVWRATPADLRRMFAALGQWNRIRQGIAPRPHWYLATLGADPEHQNLGLAARLALHGLARADADGGVDPADRVGAERAPLREDGLPCRRPLRRRGPRNPGVAHPAPPGDHHPSHGPDPRRPPLSPWHRFRPLRISPAP